MFAYLLVLLVMITFNISVQETLAQVNSGLIPIVALKPLIQEFPVPSGSQPHDVAPAKNGSVPRMANKIMTFTNEGERNTNPMLQK